MHRTVPPPPTHTHTPGMQFSSPNIVPGPPFPHPIVRDTIGTLHIVYKVLNEVNFVHCEDDLCRVKMCHIYCSGMPVGETLATTLQMTKDISEKLVISPLILHQRDTSRKWAAWGVGLGW